MTDRRPAVELVGLTVSRAGRRVLDGVSFSLGAGEILAVVGPNGAGKSTLLEATVGLLRSTADRVVGCGKELRSFADHARVFAFMPDEARLAHEALVRDILGAVGAVRPAGAPTESRPGYVDRLGVRPLLSRRGAELSRGEAKRVALAATLSLDRPVVVLDEPFGAFDPVQIDDILEVVRDCARGGAAVIVTIHQMATAERIADRVLLLAEGRAIATGTIEELRASAGIEGASFEQVFRRLLSKRSEDAAS